MLCSNCGMYYNWNAQVATAETIKEYTFISDEDSIIYWLMVLFSTVKGIGTYAGAIQS